MTSKKQRRRISPEFKANVAIEALKERESIAELAKRFKVHPTQVSTWKKQLIEGGSGIFASGGETSQQDHQELIDELYRKIGQHEMELDWLKKKSGIVDSPEAHASRRR
jgi:transposase